MERALRRTEPVAGLLAGRPARGLTLADPSEDHVAASDRRRQSIYLPMDMLKEIEQEANRLDRSLSWIVQRAWTIASRELTKYRDTDEPAGPSLTEREPG